MSSECYYQLLCKKGHYTTEEAVEFDEPENRPCKICEEKIAWWNIVDQTNGICNEGHCVVGSTERCQKCKDRIDGYIKLNIKSQDKCKECGHIKNEIYHIPRKGRVKK